MEEPKTLLEQGTLIKTGPGPLEDAGGFLVAQRFCDTRSVNTDGVILGWVAGCGGDVYWVFHGDELPEPDSIDDSDVSVYGWWEFDIRNPDQSIPLESVCSGSSEQVSCDN